MADDLRYPVGRFVREPHVSREARAGLIDQIARLPGQFSAAVAGLTDAQLDTPYRPGGWTVRQVAHHVPDSHLNAYVRCKLAATETNPVVKTYEENDWSNLPDVGATPVATSLALLAALHSRWVVLLRALDDAAFARPSQHPDMGAMTIDDYLQMYAWHGRHHTAHITQLAKRSGWQ
jgi:hypothetical protein